MTDVYIAQGHGRRPDGTFDPGASDGIHNEQRDSKPVAEACTQVLREAGLVVISESDMADDPNFYGTTARANEAGVKCVVSFHYDWNQAPPGAFAIATTDDGRNLGWAIEARVAEAGFDIRDYPDDRDGLYLLDNSRAPAVIFECGRIGHSVIDETHEQEAMGEAAALGILDWLGVDMAQKIPLEDWAQSAFRWAVDNGVYTEKTNLNEIREPYEFQQLMVGLWRVADQRKGHFPTGDGNVDSTARSIARAARDRVNQLVGHLRRS